MTRAGLNRVLAVGLLIGLVGLVAGGPAAAEHSGFEVIAHRGASAHAPENTLPAFEIALEQGTLHLELDVQLTGDGRAVVFHDRRLRPKAPAEGAVGDHDLAFLQDLDLAPWFHSVHPEVRVPDGETRIASLAQVFERFGERPRYHIEIKSRDAELPARVVALVREFALEKRVRITSFEFEQLLRVRREHPKLPLCWLLPRAKKIIPQTTPSRDELARLRRDAIDRAASQRIGRVGLPALEIDAALVAYARERSVEVRAWRVGDLRALEAAWQAGAVGATVDWPGRALEWLRGAQGAAR